MPSVKPRSIQTIPHMSFWNKIQFLQKGGGEGLSGNPGIEIFSSEKP